MLAFYVILLIEVTKAQRPQDHPYDATDVSQGSLVYPVPFGHIFKEGFGDPYSEFKQPVDMLEVALRTPKDREEAERLWKEAKIKKIPVLTYRHFNQRDDFIDEDGEIMEERLKEQNASREFWPKLQSLAALQLRNAMSPHRISQTKKTQDEPEGRAKAAVAPPGRGNKTDYFQDAKFDLIPERSALKENWTTCDEFGTGVSFNPKDIVDIEWVPFYVWSHIPMRQATVHRFTFPTKKLVKEFYDKYHRLLNKTVDWQHPKLLMTEMLKTLLIAVNRKGLFVGIHEHSVPSAMEGEQFTIPTLNVRLKIIDPYLAFMICDVNYATIMAVAGDEPLTFKEKVAEAGTLGFRGSGRPVWRDVKAEIQKENMERIGKQMEEERKKIGINDRAIPPLI